MQLKFNLNIIMVKRSLWSIVIIIAILFSHSLALSNPSRDDNPKVLVFTKTEGFRHGSIVAGVEAIRKLGSQHGFSVQNTDDSAVFSDDLGDFDAIILLNTTGNFLNASEQRQLKRFVQAGGGIVGLHAAADALYEWPWYGKLIGAYFDGHPAVQGATLNVKNPNNPATAFLPLRWKVTDEWYNFKSISSKNNVLITIDESTYKGGTNGKKHPMSWYKEYDGGRSFYTGMGHTDEIFSEPLFLRHLLEGIRYAIGAKNI